MIEKKETYTTKQIVNLVISLFFMFVFGWICPTWGEVTRQGVQAIGIFIGGIWMFATRFGMVAPSLLIIFAMIFTGYNTGDKIIGATLGSSVVWQLIIIFVVLYAVTESGADAVLARWMISRKAFNGKPRLFTSVFFLAATVLGAIASALGAYLFSIAMVDSLAKTAGYEDHSQWKKAMYTGSIVCASIGGGILPFKGMALMIFSLMQTGLLEAGVQIDQVSYMASAALAGVLVAICFGLAIKPLFRADLSKLAAVDVAAVTAEGGTHFSKRQGWSLGLFFIGFAYSIVMVFLPKSIPGYATFASIGQGMWFAFMVVLMFLIHIDGKPLLKPDQAMGKAVHWGIVLAVCAFTSIGGMVSDEALGVRGWLAGIMSALLGNMPLVVFVFVLVILTLLMTNVFSNTATAVIIGTIIGPLLATYGLTLGINVSCLIPAIVMSALCAFLTMAAGGSAPLYLGTETMRDKPSWVFKYGLWVFPIVAVPSTLAYVLLAYIL